MRKFNCQQNIKYIENCKNIHVGDACLAYHGQYCSQCQKHWSNCHGCLKSDKHQCEENFLLPLAVNKEEKK